jgi:hypothetical protein
MTYVIAFAVGALVGLAGAAVIAGFGFRLVRRARRCS